MTSDSHAYFGLFSKKNFPGSEDCERIRLEMDSSGGNPATIIKRENRLLDESVRRTMTKEVSEETRSHLRGKLSGISDELGAYFGVELSDMQGPQFLCYRVGDFFLRHTDKGMYTESPREIKDRQVSAVVFLKDETDEPGNDTYTGGSFIIYGILKDPRFELRGFKVTGTAGTLIAFRSEMYHEVTPVTGGTRLTIVSWFL